MDNPGLHRGLLNANIEAGTSPTSIGDLAPVTTSPRRRCSKTLKILLAVSACVLVGTAVAVGVGMGVGMKGSSRHKVGLSVDQMKQSSSRKHRRLGISVPSAARFTNSSSGVLAILCKK